MGTQYRSAIFTHSEEQAEVAEASMAEASNLLQSLLSLKLLLPILFTLRRITTKTFIETINTTLLPNGDSPEIKVGWRWCDDGLTFVLMDLIRTCKNHSFAVFSSKDTGDGF